VTFSFDLSDSLRETLLKLSKKDKPRALIINKKIKEIVSQDEISIQHYKNLRHDLSDYKRVHIDKSFVLVFRVFLKERYISFEKFVHHDDAY